MLKQYWLKFANEDNEEKKIDNLLEFFYQYHYHYRSRKGSPQPQAESIIASVPSHINSFLLHKISTEIAKAENDGQSAGVRQYMLESDFYQLFLSTPSDISGIASLRTFLTHGLGQHMLEFLAVCDMHQLTSTNILRSLLFKLFPSSPWETDSTPLSPTPSFASILNDFYLQSRTDFPAPFDLEQFQNLSVKDDELQLTFEEFRSKQINSPEIAVVIIKILARSLLVESGIRGVLPCFEFASVALCSGYLKKAFASPEAVRAVGLHLLRLIEVCFNVIFVDNLREMQMRHLVPMLFQILKENDSREVQLAVLYMYFAITHNFLAYKKNLLIYHDLLPKNLENLPVFKDDESEFIKYFSSLLLRIIERIDAICNERKSRRRSQNSTKSKFECEQKQVTCLVLKTIFQFLPVLQPDAQKMFLKNIAKIPVCSCLNTSEVLVALLTPSHPHTVQKTLYNYLSGHVLTEIARHTTNTKEFSERMILLYKNKANSIEDPREFLLFLKHLQSVLAILPTEAILNILQEVILPLFKGEEDPNLLFQCLQIYTSTLCEEEFYYNFYIKENAYRLESLLGIGSLNKSICKLIKIGIENSVVIGSGCAKVLRGIQLKWSRKVLIDIGMEMKKLHLDAGLPTVEHWELEPSAYDKTTIQEKVELATMLWSVNSELFRNNELFASILLSMFSTSITDDEHESFLSLPQFMRALLETFLHRPKGHDQRGEDDQPAEVRFISNQQSDKDLLLHLNSFNQVAQLYEDDNAPKSDFRRSLSQNSVSLLFDINNQQKIDGAETFFQNVCGYFFGEATAVQKKPAEVEEECLLSRKENKRFMLKLFEAIFLIILVQQKKEDSASKMRGYLRKLKNVIVSSEENWQDARNVNEIVQTLQSLLNVAEIACNLGRATPPKDKRLMNNSSNGSYMDCYPRPTGYVDSELELTENEQEEPVEGYDADGEIDAVSEDEANSNGDSPDHMWHPFIPASRYRSHSIHEGVCRLITKILIKLSKKCIKDPVNWAGQLSKLVTRFYVLRDSLGGSLLILNGFSSILHANDPLLRDFQEAILNLITDIASPDELVAYLKNLSAEKPPTEVLVKYLVYIARSHSSRQARVELAFPVKKLVHFNMENGPSNNADIPNPFLKAAGILPLHCDPLPNGFTISTWLQVKAVLTPTPGFTTSTQLNWENAPLRLSGKPQHTHLLTVGSKQFLFSVYITKNMHFVFEISTHPKFANIEEQCRVHKKCKKGANCPSNKENSHSHPSALKSTIRHTKSMILNSFNHLINGAHEPSCQLASSELLYLNLPKGKWKHCTFAVALKADCVEVITTIDGSEQYALNLECNVKKTNPRLILEALCYGQASNADTSPTVEYGISNIMLFGTAVGEKARIRHLTALGPNATNLAVCMVGNTKPNYSYLSYSHPEIFSASQFIESIKFLNQHQICYLSPSCPDRVIYGKGLREGIEDASSEGVLLGQVEKSAIMSLQASILLSGGLSVLLYLFARVVELTTDSNVQSMALELLFDLALSDSTLYTEFLKRDCLCLISNVIKTDLCAKDPNMVKVFINSACNQPVVVKRSDALVIQESTAACVVHANIIINVISHYADWHHSSDCRVLLLVLKSIAALVRDKHPHKNFNMHQLATGGLVQELFNFCKVSIVESTNPVLVSTECADLLVDLLRVFAGSPPAPSILDELMKLLILLHKPSECYINHDRSRFYFLVSLDSPVPTAQAKVSPHNRAKRKISTKHCNVNQRKDLDGRRHVRRASGAKNITQVLNNIENLEEIADCSRLKQKITSTMTKYEAVISTLSKQVKNNLKHNGNTQVFKRKRKWYPPRKMTVSECSSKANSLPEFDSRGYDIIDQDEVLSLSVKQKTSLGTLVDHNFYYSEGIVRLQENILSLLKDFLLILPDSQIDMVLSHYVKIDILLVLANNRSSIVRTTILRLIAAIYGRLPASEIVTYTKKHYWHHLGNQMALYPVEYDLVNAAFQIVASSIYNLDDFCGPKVMHVANAFAVNTMLAIVPQIYNPDMTAKAFASLKKMFYREFPQVQVLIEAGVVQVTVKALYTHLSRSAALNSNCVTAIFEFMRSISERFIKTPGQINSFWDLVNLISFYRNHRNADHVVQGMQSAQAEVLRFALALFFTTNMPGSLKGSSIATMSEIHTRWEMVYDRCCQFFMSPDLAIQYGESEINLLEYLIALTLSEKMRTTNFLAWILQPASPSDLKTFLVNFIARKFSKEELDNSFLLYNDKIVKGILSCLWKQESQPSAEFKEVCKTMGVSEKSPPFNIENVFEKSSSLANKDIFSGKHKSSIQNSVYRMEALVQACIESSMAITRTVTEVQNSERKVLMSTMKRYSKCYAYTEWTAIVQHMTHEGAPWHAESSYAKSWSLDATEGPHRVHSRLKRVHLDLDKRFFLEQYEKKRTKPALEYLMNTLDQEMFSLDCQVLHNFPAKYVPIDGDIDGEIIVTDTKMYFFATHNCRYFYIIFDINEIAEIWVRRYQHLEKAIEIYLETNKSVFIAFENKEDFQTVKELFSDKIVEFADQHRIHLLTQQWREGGLTNWEYLMSLNQISGRTYNDLMQYPVFPWILSNYAEHFLDLTDAANFRKLEKPIAIQHKESEQHYIENYEYIASTITSMGTLQLKPYHYSSLYSNSGTVLNFLLRVPPFTGFFLKYQDNNFDRPDRTFHSINSTWLLASRDSQTDVKEITPEFFCLSEIFENNEGFNFGERQSGESVHDVLLPPWCQNDPRLFVLIHRQALESELVRSNLNHWIDLIFGYKQTGQAAVDAVNVFHPSTYSDFVDSQVVDPIEREAVETMIKTYGQMPKQLFKSPHPSSKSVEYSHTRTDFLPNVKGLRWGAFTGSPQLTEPFIKHSFELPCKGSLLAFPHTNVVYALPLKTAVCQGARSDTYNLISWDNPDQTVRIQPLTCTDNADFNVLLLDSSFDEISTCGACVNSNTLWIGHRSGRISVYTCARKGAKKVVKMRQTYIPGFKLSYNSAFWKNAAKVSLKLDDFELRNDEAETSNMQWTGPVQLVRHTDEVTAISLCAEFKVAVSVGKDGLAVIWDLNSLTYIRTISRPSEIHTSPITIVAISPTLGDIITIHAINTSANKADNSRTDECFEVTEDTLEDFVNVSINPNGKSLMRLHSVNAKYINHVVHEDNVTAVCYSYEKEGVGINVVVTALQGGIVRFWASWNLAFVREINTGIAEIISITYSTYQHLCVLNENNIVQVWESGGLSGIVPKLPQISYR